MPNFYNDNKHIKFHLSHPLMKKIISMREMDFVEKDKFEHAPIDFEDAIDSYEKVLEIVGETAREPLRVVGFEPFDRVGGVPQLARVGDREV